MTPIRLLILGTGAMAEGHAKAFGAMEGVTLAGAVDVDADRLTDFADQFGIAGVEDLDRVDLGQEQGFAMPDRFRDSQALQLIAPEVTLIRAADQPFLVPDQNPCTWRRRLHRFPPPYRRRSDER